MLKTVSWNIARRQPPLEGGGGGAGSETHSGRRVAPPGGEPQMELDLTGLIARAPWREAVTYRETWPHEYVLSERDGQQELLEAVVARFRVGEGVACRFFSMNNTYLFVGEHKYWLMTHWDDLEPGGNYVINRARLYRDRRDFVIQPGDTGRPEDYPVNPAR